MRILILMAAVAVPTSGIVWGFVWWQDRPVRHITNLLDDEDYASALQHADRFLAQAPGDIRAQMLKARALTALGQYEAADALFQRLALRNNGFPDDSDALRAWSVSLLHMQQWSRAISILETLAASFPTDAEVLYRLTVARIRLRRYHAALESAEQLVKIPGHEDQANVMVGTIHHDRGNRRAAIDAWDTVLKSNPKAENLQITPGAFLAMIGEDVLEMGESERAASLLERSVADDPAGRAYALLGNAYSELARPEEAIEAWKKALEYDELNPTAREELANVALRGGRPQEAVDLMAPFESAPNLNSSSAYMLQRAYAQLKQPEKADHWRARANTLRDAEKVRSTLTELIRNSRDPFWSGYLYAYKLADEGQWGQAENIVRDLLIQRPSDASLRALAEAIMQRGTLPPLGGDLVRPD